MNKRVPNKFPTQNPYERRLALIGEAPGAVEEEKGTPFVGTSGRFLALLLRRAGVSIEQCFLGNVHQYRPPGNDFNKIDWNSPAAVESRRQLRADLEAFKPNITVALGNAALHWLRYGESPPRFTSTGYKWQEKVHDWRGTLFLSPLVGKSMATYHPAYALRDYSATPLLQFDLKRAVSESASATLTLPKRELLTNLTADSLLKELQALKAQRKLIAVDIEGGISGVSCISFADRPERAFVVPFFYKDGTSVNDSYHEALLWRAVADVLEDHLVPKVLQNSLYDRFVLQYACRIRIRGVQDDTMLKFWELYSELPKSLAMQASLLTKEPFYKAERRTEDDQTFFAYCCRDSAVTYEVNQVLEGLLGKRSREHYRFNMSLLHALLYMELRGIQYDSRLAEKRRRELLQEKHECQFDLDTHAGYGLPRDCTRQFLLKLAASELCLKRVPVQGFSDIPNASKKAKLASALRFLELVHQPATKAVLGEIESLLGLALNVNSPEFKYYLYSDQKLPEQVNKKTMRSTADYEALLKLWKRTGHQATKLAMRIRSLDTRSRMLSIHADKDGRIRCGYNIVGTETGRVTCYESPTGSGYNLQTIPKYDRDLFLADSGCWFFQCDLAGADGWTVAAYCKLLGDPTMLDDYLFGLKPAKILCLKMRGVQVDFEDRHALLEASKQVKSSDWDYFGCKQTQHGTSYMEGAQKVSDLTFTGSEGEFRLSVQEARMLQAFFHSRYPGVRRWHEWVAQRLAQSPVLTTASGQTRYFFGRKEEILPAALAHEPQANTTYATNLALHRLWHDPENMTADGKLLVEPLHQVHDALCGQFAKPLTDWAVSKIREWFRNPLKIAHQTVIIPFEGGYGPSWGDLSVGII